MSVPTAFHKKVFPDLVEIFMEMSLHDMFSVVLNESTTYSYHWNNTLLSVRVKLKGDHTVMTDQYRSSTISSLMEAGVLFAVRVHRQSLPRSHHTHTAMTNISPLLRSSLPAGPAKIIEHRTLKSKTAA